MKTLLEWLFWTCSVGGVLFICTATVCWGPKVSPNQTVTVVKKWDGLRTSITRRQKNFIVINVPWVRTHDLYGWKMEGKETKRIEVTDKAFKSVQIGDTYTVEQIEDMRGRSLMGSAWDFWKKPR